jgi:DNA adenine methylase
MKTESKPSRVRPILRWPGGKSRMLKHLLPLIPKHVCYCEPFAGGLAVLLAKPRSPVEVVNDLNGDLVALYRNLQYHLPELLREIDWMFSSRQALFDYMAQPGITEIQRAARFLLRNRTSFAGHMTSFAVAKTKGGGSAFNRAGAGELLGNAHERMDKVVVEHLPYDRCLKLYDSKDTFFFADPPYLNCDIHTYKGWKEEDLLQFRKTLDGLQGRWVVTLDDSPFNRDLFKDCKLKAVTSRNGAMKNSSAKQFGELIIAP